MTINEFFFNIIFSIFIFLVGLMFLKSSHRNIDSALFRRINDKRILKYGSQVSFCFCCSMSLLLLINSTLSLYIESVSNITAISFFMGFFLPWPIRILSIFLYKNKTIDEVPIFWPISLFYNK